MSTPLPISSSSLAASADARSFRWLREPLLHFVLLGALLFLADAAIDSRADDPHVIDVAAGRREATRTFQAASGRAPTAEELTSLVQVWLDNEVLYREGLAMGLDKGDQTLRDRVIFKALSTIDASVKLPAIDDAQLRAWFEARRDRYDRPARYDFLEAVLDGDSSEGTVRAFVSALSSGTPGNSRAGLRVFKGRPAPTLVESYGDEFPQALAGSPVGEWRALRGLKGWHAMRLESVTPAEPASYEALRGIVMQDGKDARAAELRTASVRALARKYTITSTAKSP